MPPVQIGRYEIIRQVGRGGMAAVYEALDTPLNRTVALKVLLDGASPGLLERFHREAAAARLQHPNIVPIHDAGQADGVHYIAMDFIHGSSLAEARRQMSPKERLEAVESIARAGATRRRWPSPTTFAAISATSPSSRAPRPCASRCAAGSRAGG